MYKHILLSTDGSDTAQKGIDHGLALAKAVGARVTIIVATEPFPLPSRSMAAGFALSETELSQFERSQTEFAERTLEGAKAAADAAGVAATGKHLSDSYPATGIIATAKADGCDLIVMASHGRRGLNRMLLGSQTSEVLAQSTVPVLVVR